MGTIKLKKDKERPGCFLSSANSSHFSDNATDKKLEQNWELALYLAS